MKYIIGITRLAIVHQKIEVGEHDSPEAAAAEALKLAKYRGAAGWEIDDVYDDGKSHCVLSANTCHDEHGIEHAIDEELDP